MKTEWLNNGEPFPEGHRKAGQVGLVIDFEDGRPDPQNVYAASQAEMTLKIAGMYGNTNIRLQEQKSQPGQAPAPAPTAPAAAPGTPTAELTADERMQLVADLGDPQRAPDAILKLIKAGGGADLVAQQQANTDQAEVARKQGETQKFVDATPDWYGTRNNATLLRDRTFARVGARFTAQDLHQSYIELQDMGVLESDQSQPRSTSEAPEDTTEEPLAPPPPPRPRASTGARPSTFGSRPGPMPQQGQPLTEAYILSIAGTEEYARRLRDEPGFMAKVEAALK